MHKQTIQTRYKQYHSTPASSGGTSGGVPGSVCETPGTGSNNGALPLAAAAFIPPWTLIPSADRFCCGPNSKVRLMRLFSKPYTERATRETGKTKGGGRVRVPIIPDHKAVMLYYFSMLRIT